ncbi:MAG: SRPBCC domain-containing protein [Actinobacteria bacterium]|nr:SRPBCC domain-containing protein [Actinomycetota bacterium]
MTRKFEKTFELSVPVERAWEVCTEPKELEAWYSPIVDEFDPKPGGRVRLRMEGMPDVEGEVLEVDRPRAIRWNEGPGLLPGTTEIAITFEETRTGTRVSITHSGFGEGDEWLAELDSHSHGWLQCIADLQLYLRADTRRRRGGQGRSRHVRRARGHAPGRPAGAARQGADLRPDRHLGRGARARARRGAGGHLGPGRRAAVGHELALRRWAEVPFPHSRTDGPEFERRLVLLWLGAHALARR